VHSGRSIVGQIARSTRSDGARNIRVLQLRGSRDVEERNGIALGRFEPFLPDGHELCVLSRVVRSSGADCPELHQPVQQLIASGNGGSVDRRDAELLQISGRKTGQPCVEQGSVPVLPERASKHALLGITLPGPIQPILIQCSFIASTATPGSAFGVAFFGCCRRGARRSAVATLGRHNWIRAGCPES